MISTTLIPYEQDQPSRVILEFIEAVDAVELRYLSCDLLEKLELEDEHLLDQAIERAINACLALSIPSGNTSGKYSSSGRIRSSGVGDCLHLVVT